MSGGAMSKPRDGLIFQYVCAILFIAKKNQKTLARLNLPAILSVPSR